MATKRSKKIPGAEKSAPGDAMLLLEEFDDLWVSVEGYRSKLASKASKQLAELERVWMKIKEGESLPAYQFRKRTAEHPLIAMIHTIGIGAYPAPELLLLLRELFLKYLRGRGELELERVFFPTLPSRKRSPSYAARYEKRQREFWNAAHVKGQNVTRGISKTKAAENIARDGADALLKRLSRARKRVSKDK